MTHSSLDFWVSVKVFNIWSNVWWKRSTCPFPCGWYGVVRDPAIIKLFF